MKRGNVEIWNEEREKQKTERFREGNRVRKRETEGMRINWRKVNLGRK